jgi:hypothetical protein
MTFDMYTWGDPSRDAVDHWLDEALRAVPLPDGFIARLSRMADRQLADRPPENSDGRDDAGRRASAHASTRGLADVSRRWDASSRPIRPC